MRETPLPVKAFFGDFIHDYFTVDSKFFNSIGLLLFRPGKLTDRFNRGKRKSYIAPFRFYIFTSVVYFTLLGLSVGDNDSIASTENQTQFKAQLASIDSLMADTSLIHNPENLSGAYADLRSESPSEIYEDALSESKRGYFATQMKRVRQNPDRYRQSMFRSASIGVFFLLPVFALFMMVLNYSHSRYYVNHLVFSGHFHTFVFVTFILFLLLQKISELVTLAGFSLLTLVYLSAAGQRILTLQARTRFRGFLRWVLLIGFAGTAALVSLRSDSAEFLMFFFALAAYLTVSMVNAYQQGFISAVVKSAILLPIYTVAIFAALVGVALLGVFLA